MRRSRLVAVLLSLWIALPLAAVAPSAPAGHGGAVASEHQLATAAGLEMLRVGGNAADAAVATALALAVVFPEAGNLGGGGFAVMRFGDEVVSLDFRETAPAAARPDMYLDSHGEPVPEASTVGPLASGVPGSPEGLFRLHQRFGRLPWATVVEPARRLAFGGFVVDRHLNAVIARYQEVLSRFPESSALWLPGGEPPAVGSVLRLPDLAATLERYARQGPPGITSGSVAAAVVAASGRHGGVLSSADLEGYCSEWRPPLRFEAFGWQFASMPLPSSGGVILGQSLHLLEDLGWQRAPRFGADRAHLLIEVLRRSFADRYLLGDPSTTEAKLEDLLAPEWLAHRRAEIDLQRATASSQVPPWPGTATPSRSVSAEGPNTTHLSVVDADGNLVALTTTLNELFGCGLYVPGAGFFLNNEMDDFATAPDRPNLYGLIQGRANAVAPGKRMLSSMSPILAWKEGEHGQTLALGGRGGSRIPTHTLQVLLALIVDGDPLQEALGRPRLHHQWLPDQVEIEPDTLSPETRAELERRGHHFVPAAILAKIEVVRRYADGRVEAASDPRSSGVGGVVTAEP